MVGTATRRNVFKPHAQTNALQGPRMLEKGGKKGAKARRNGTKGQGAPGIPPWTRPGERKKRGDYGKKAKGRVQSERMHRSRLHRRLATTSDAGTQPNRRHSCAPQARGGKARPLPAALPTPAIAPAVRPLPSPTGSLLAPHPPQRPALPRKLRATRGCVRAGCIGRRVRNACCGASNDGRPRRAAVRVEST